MVHDTPRAVVVDDSHFMRTVISDILEDGGVEVVETATDGAEGVRAVLGTEPDVVTMDVQMPNVDGLAAVERIMAERPTPILMLSAHTEEGSEVTFEALEAGAVDFFSKPGGEVSVEMSGFGEELVETVRTVARADVRGAAATSPAAGTPTRAVKPAGYRENPTVAVGASTGGPSVVEDVLAGFPADAGVRVLVVQHMPDEFTGRFADRLDDSSELSVREAADGDRIEGGEAAVAPGGYHLEVGSDRRGKLRLELTEDPPVNGVRPAIDVTMRSAADTVEGTLVGVVLTGMGEDGARGVEAVSAAGGHVIAQDEETSTVYGMPKRAAETGTVDEVLPAGEVAAAALDALAKPEAEG